MLTLTGPPGPPSRRRRPDRLCRQHRHYKLGFASALAAPAPSASALVSAAAAAGAAAAAASASAASAARYGGEISPSRPVGLLPVINHQISSRAASKLPASAPVPFPTVAQPLRAPSAD